MRLPRNTAMVLILRATLICLTRIIPMISLRPRTMRKRPLKSQTSKSPRLTGKTRRSVSPASGRYSAIEMRWKMKGRKKNRTAAHLIHFLTKTRSLKSSLVSEIPASMQMTRQISTGEGVTDVQDSTTMMISNMTTSIPMMKMMTS